VPPSRKPGPVLLVGALVAVAVLMAALAGPWQLQRRLLPDTSPPALGSIPASTPEPSTTSTDFPREEMPIEQERWIFLVILSLIGLVLVLILAFVVRRIVQKMRERRVGREIDAADPDIPLEGDVVDLATAAMRAGARQAVQVLEQEVPPGDAVIAALVALESSAERTGIHRDRAQTATEFTIDVLRGTHADPQAAQTLLDLYLAARYSEHRLTPQDVEVARTSLTTISEGLS